MTTKRRKLQRTVKQTTEEEEQLKEQLDDLGPESEEEVPVSDDEYVQKEKKKSSKKEKPKRSTKTKKTNKKELKVTVKLSNDHADLPVEPKKKNQLSFKIKSGVNKGKRKRSFRQIVSKQDLESSENGEVLDDALDEDNDTTGNSLQNLTYSSIEAGTFSIHPKRKYCDITGLPCKYTNPHNKIQYHSSLLIAPIQSLSEERIQHYLSLRNVHDKNK